MIIFPTRDELQQAQLQPGDMIRVLGNSAEGDEPSYTGRVRSGNYATDNELIDIANGLKVELFPRVTAEQLSSAIDLARQQADRSGNEANRSEAAAEQSEQWTNQSEQFAGNSANFQQQAAGSASQAEQAVEETEVSKQQAEVAAIKSETSAKAAEKALESVLESHQRVAVPTPVLHLPLTSNLLLSQGVAYPCQLDISLGQDGSQMVDLPFYQGVFSRDSKATMEDIQENYVELDVDQPRFERDGFFIEKSSTNLCVHSTDTSKFRKSSTVVTSDGESLLGTQSLQVTLNESGENIDRIIFIDDLASSYTVSLFIKGVAGEQMMFYGNYFTGDRITLTHTFTGIWDRVSLYCKNPGGVSDPRFYLGVKPVNAPVTFSVHHPQLEIGSMVTSYIPTKSTVSTRAADVPVEIPLSSLPIGEGTIFVQGKDLIRTGGTISQIWADRLNTEFDLYISGNGLTARYADSKITTPWTNPQKIVVTYSLMQHCFCLYVDGQLIDEAALNRNPVFSATKRFFIGGRSETPDSSNNLQSGHLKDFKAWPIALTSEQVASL